MRNKRVHSIKEELIKKSREGMISAVQIYNNPSITFKAETFITLSIISWTYLLHAYYRAHGIDYRYFSRVNNRKRYDKTKHGAYKHWELERCLDDKHCPLDISTIANLKFLIGIRHEIEHQMTNRIDEFLSAKLQACAINYDYYVNELFGEKYSVHDELALSIQFSPLTPEQRNTLSDNEHIMTNVKNFIVEFEDVLKESTLTDSRYAYRVLFVPINTNRKGQADQVVEFISSDSPLANDVTKTYAMLKETEKPKYLPGQIVNMMKEKGYMEFSITKHTELWKSYDAKNPKKGYGTSVANQWYWYNNWLKIVEDYCKKEYGD